MSGEQQNPSWRVTNFGEKEEKEKENKRMEVMVRTPPKRHVLFIFPPDAPQLLAMKAFPFLKPPMPRLSESRTVKRL